MPRSIPESIETLKTYVRKRYNVVDLESIEITSEGEQRYFLNNIRGITKDGYLLKAWGVQRDITKQREMETELIRNQKDLQKLAGWLISQQEKEYSRIARELHDDLTQQLAVVAIEAGSIEEQFKDMPESVRQRVARIKERLIKTSKDVHNLSRTLHPSIINDLGLERAVKSECSNFSERSGIAVVFEPRDVPVNIPAEVSLSVYRIIQECLLNIAKHAKTKSAYVFLERSGGRVALTVKDTGVGFDTREVRSRPALGMGSMRERVRLVNGEISIASEPGKGTRVEVAIPLNQEKRRVTKYEPENKD
jgi:signal transduction histidine kinase